MKNKTADIYKLTITSLMTALTCVLAPFAIPLPFSPVPLSLTHIPVFLSLYLLGWRSGTVSYLLYLFLGLVGMPVFSGFSGGPGKLAGPTGGYLIGFILMALIAGAIIEKSRGRLFPSAAGMILGDAAACLFGTFWLCAQLNIGFTEGLLIGVVPYLPGDALKIAAAAIAGPHLKKAISGIGRGRNILLSFEPDNKADQQNKNRDEL